MTLNEEIDKIIDNVEVDNKKFKSELLALFERKMNEVVPESTVSMCASIADFKFKRDFINEMQQNIKKVLEGK